MAGVLARITEDPEQSPHAARACASFEDKRTPVLEPVCSGMILREPPVDVSQGDFEQRRVCLDLRRNGHVQSIGGIGA